MRRKQYVCYNCGEMFDEDELIAVYSLEGEGCMQGELFEDYKCPDCRTMSINETIDYCPYCKWYDKEDDECLWDEPVLIDILRKEGYDPGNAERKCKK